MSVYSNILVSLWLWGLASLTSYNLISSNDSSSLENPFNIMLSYSLGFVQP